MASVTAELTSAYSCLVALVDKGGRVWRKTAGKASAQCSAALKALGHEWRRNTRRFGEDIARAIDLVRP